MSAQVGDMRLKNVALKKQYWIFLLGDCCKYGEDFFLYEQLSPQISEANTTKFALLLDSENSLCMELNVEPCSHVRTLFWKMFLTCEK